MHEKAVAKALIETDAVCVSAKNPFRYTNQLTSPIFIQVQALLRDPITCREIVKALEALARDKFWRFRTVAGTAVSGVTWAALLSQRMNVPVAYVYDKAQSFGHKSKIEGRITPGEKVLVVDDLIATGGQAANTVRSVRRAGGEPVGVVSIFDYGLKTAERKLEGLGVSAHSLTSLSTLMSVAIRHGTISREAELGIYAWANKLADRMID